MKKTKNLTLSAIFASLICVSTFFIQIPIPATHGYIHLGDALVILCAVFLNPTSAFLAAGIGSSLSDLIGGYFIYIPATFFIKGLIAYVASQFFKKYKSQQNISLFPIIFCGVIDLVFVILGYAIFESILYGWKAALLAVPANTIQGLSGLILATLFYRVLSTIPEVKKLWTA